MNNGVIAGITSFLSSVAAKFMDEPTSLSHHLREHGFEHLGSGISRRTFAHPLVPGVVFKVEVSSVEKQAEVEYETWLSATDIMKEYIAPIHHYEGGVTVQERVHGPMQREMETDHTDMRFIHKFYRNTRGFRDAHYENYMYDTTRDRMVLVDYGGGCA